MMNLAAEIRLEKGADGKAQTILHGAERSARQAAQARNDHGRGMIKPKVPQLPPAGLFALEAAQPEMF